MPIRFRCPECRQLLGISGRKGGSNVKCPNCSSMVRVPAEGEENAGKGRPIVFERSDFDEVFPQGKTRKPKSKAFKEVVAAPAEPAVTPRAEPHPPAQSDPSEDDSQKPVIMREASQVDFEWVARPDEEDSQVQAVKVGVYLSPPIAVIWGILVVIALILAFGTGMYVGIATSRPIAQEKP